MVANIHVVMNGGGPQLLVVLSTGEPLRHLVTDELYALGAARLEPLLRAPLDQEQFAPVAFDAGDLAPCTVWSPPALDETLRARFDALGAAGFMVTVVVAWEEPSRLAAAHSGAPRALALVRWEEAVRSALDAARDHRCLVLPPGYDDATRRALAALVAGETFARSADPEVASHSDVLSSQRSLAETCWVLVGMHEVLGALDLGEPGCWTAALADADRRARASASDAADAWAYAHERAEDASVTWRALWHVSAELADAADPRS